MRIPTVHKRAVRRVLAAAAAGAVLAGTGLGFFTVEARAQAMGCETVAWPTLLNWAQKRTVCDTPRRADGSWTRYRELWTPAGYVPASSYCGTYSCSFTGGYYRQRSTAAYEEYVVFDHNIPPNEPGWLPPGTVVIR